MSDLDFSKKNTRESPISEMRKKNPAQHPGKRQNLWDWGLKPLRLPRAHLPHFRVNKTKQHTSAGLFEFQGYERKKGSVDT